MILHSNIFGTILLANAMNPEFNGELRYGFIDMIKNITAIEALFLNKFYEVLRKDNKLDDISKINQYYLTKEQIMKIEGIDEENYLVSIYNLMRMQCIGPAILKSTSDYTVGYGPTTFYIADAVVLTPLGVKFVEACIK